jgi:TRAP-type C4-dicarboxylate transport system permease large subunit
MTIPLLILCVSFTLFLLLGVPVAFSIGLSALATLAYEGLPLAVVFQQMTSGMGIFSFLAIPFFIFAGELMLYGGIADRIVDFARNLVGHVRGGLGMSNVVACTLFGGVSGSPVADVSAMGAVMIPMMKKEGYHADYAVNVTTHAALVGALMPTSHNLIIYSLAAGGKVSIAALILAGPAAGRCILTISNLAAAYGVARQARLPGRHLPGLGDRGALLRSGAARAVHRRPDPRRDSLGHLHRDRIGGRGRALCAGMLTIFLYRTLKWETFVKAASKAVRTTGVMLLLIGISSTFGYLISLYGVAELTGQMLSQITSTPWMIFLMINIILFVLGTFLDMAATILLCTPIFLPIAQQYGMTSVQFGIVMLINCALGLNTPPVGTTQFVGCAIGGVSVGTVMKTIWPFYGALIFALGLVTFVPAFSTWLPSLFMVVK